MFTIIRMKLKLKYIIGLLGVFGIILFLNLSTQLFSNLWGILIGNGYIIPKQSSIFTFKATEMNNGNGDYWLYGEDAKNYYTTLKKDHVEPYTVLSKKQVDNIGYFDETNYLTWFPEFFCGDLLKKYANKPENLEFVKCEVSSNIQTIVEAEYRVSGKKYKEIESYLVENHKMGKIIWECCGWSNGGSYGQFEHKAFKQIDDYCSATISMYAEGITDKHETFNASDVEFFKVIVKIIVV